ncbi:MAG: mechanosensitive ion channel [Methylibium sp.]|nr:mechanosensitive ion channel [Methylibium sp.]
MTGWLFAVCAAPSVAQDAPAGPAASAPSAIAAKVSSTESQDIAARIRSIFWEIPQMRSVQVGVSAGVVSLSGTVPSADDVKRAEAIASRVSGVVTIQNDLERDLTLATSLTPTLGQFKADLRSLVRALPLIGVALAIGLVIILFGYLLASVDRLWRWLMPNPFLAEIAATFMRFFAIVLGLVAMLEVLGATALLGGVLGGAGVVGIALGFAVRDTVDNYVSSLMLSLRQPFRANDHVVIEGHEGRVIRLTSRATVLMTLDGNHLRIPNSVVFKSVILNYTRNAERRFSFDLGVDAADDPVDGMAVGLAAVNALKFVIDEPAATAVIQNVGDSNIVLRFYGWIDQDNTDFLTARSLAIQAAKSSLERAGFALPEPIYRLRFDETAPLLLRNAVKAGPPAGRAMKQQGAIPAQDIDTSPDTHIERLVAKERARVNESDLLDSARPIE